MIAKLAVPALVLALASPAWAQSDPFASLESPMVMRDAQGHELARGQLTQVAKGDALDVTIVFHFANGRTTTETSSFTVRPKVIQHSWKYEDSTAGKVTRRFFADVDQGRAGAMKLDDDGKPETWIKSFDKAPGKYFSGVGFVYAVIGNMGQLSKGPMEFQAVGFLPKPVTAKVKLSLGGREMLKVEGRQVSAVKVTIHPDLGWLVKMIAHPRDFHLWFSTTPPTRFVRSEAPVLEANDPMVVEDVLR